MFNFFSMSSMNETIFEVSLKAQAFMKFTFVFILFPFASWVFILILLEDEQMLSRESLISWFYIT